MLRVHYYSLSVENFVVVRRVKEHTFIYVNKFKNSWTKPLSGFLRSFFVALGCRTEMKEKEEKKRVFLNPVADLHLLFGGSVQHHILRIHLLFLLLVCSKTEYLDRNLRLLSLVNCIILWPMKQQIFFIEFRDRGQF